MVPDCYRRLRACDSRHCLQGSIVPVPLDLHKFIDDLADAIIAEITECGSSDEIRQMVEELELRLWKSRLH